MPYTPKQKRLAAMAGDKKKITKADIIAVAQRKKLAIKKKK